MSKKKFKTKTEVIVDVEFYAGAAHFQIHKSASSKEYKQHSGVDPDYNKEVDEPPEVYTMCESLFRELFKESY